MPSRLFVAESHPLYRGRWDWVAFSHLLQPFQTLCDLSVKLLVDVFLVVNIAFSGLYHVHWNVLLLTWCGNPASRDWLMHLMVRLPHSWLMEGDNFVLLMGVLQTPTQFAQSVILVSRAPTRSGPRCHRLNTHLWVQSDLLPVGAPATIGATSLVLITRVPLKLSPYTLFHQGSDFFLSLSQSLVLPLKLSLELLLLLFWLLDQLTLLGYNLFIFLIFQCKFFIVILYFFIFIQNLQKIIVLLFELGCQFLQVILSLVKVELHLIPLPLECVLLTLQYLQALLHLKHLRSHLHLLTSSCHTTVGHPNSLWGALASELLLSSCCCFEVRIDMVQKRTWSVVVIEVIH